MKLKANVTGLGKIFCLALILIGIWVFFPKNPHSSNQPGPNPDLPQKSINKGSKQGNRGIPDFNPENSPVADFRTFDPADPVNHDKFIPEEKYAPSNHAQNNAQKHQKRHTPNLTLQKKIASLSVTARKRALQTIADLKLPLNDESLHVDDNGALFFVCNKMIPEGIDPHAEVEFTSLADHPMRKGILTGTGSQISRNIWMVSCKVDLIFVL